MRVKEFSISSFVVLLCLSVGCTLGYIYAASECAHYKQAAEEQSLFIGGRWWHRPEIIDVLKEKARSSRAGNR